MPMSVAAALRTLGPLQPGDVACLNDPFDGGTHLPDITVVTPVFDTRAQRGKRERAPAGQAVPAEPLPKAGTSVDEIYYPITARASRGRGTSTPSPVYCFSLLRRVRIEIPRMLAA